MGIKDFSKVNNGLVLAFFEMLRFFQKFAAFSDSKRSLKNLDINNESIKLHEQMLINQKGFVEDQNNYSDLLYGRATMKGCGCEVFAVYNVLQSLRSNSTLKYSLPELIQYFEKDGMVLSGKFGTSPKALYKFFTKHGFATFMTKKEVLFDSLGEKYPTFILTFYNDVHDITKEVHTVCITREAYPYAGKDKFIFFAHNVYCNGKVLGPKDSISELISCINNGNAKGISLIGIGCYNRK